MHGAHGWLLVRRSPQVGQFAGADGVARQERDQVVVIVAGGGELDVVQVDTPQLGMAEPFP
ncbi:MAG TPA: hypothetical protein VF942_03095 [Acidimicrobiales bacterium]